MTTRRTDVPGGPDDSDEIPPPGATSNPKPGGRPTGSPSGATQNIAVPPVKGPPNYGRNGPNRPPAGRRDNPRRADKKDKGFLASLPLLGGIAAIFGRGSSGGGAGPTLGHGTVEAIAGSAGSLGPEAAGGIAASAGAVGAAAAGTAGGATAAGGAVGAAGVAGGVSSSGAGITAGTAGATGAGAAAGGGAAAGAGGGAGAASGPGALAQPLAIGAVGVTAVAAVAAAVVLTGGDPPPAPDPTTTTIEVAIAAEPMAPTGYSAEAAAPMNANLLADVPDDGETYSIISVEGSESGLGSPVQLASGATIAVSTSGDFTYDPGIAFEALGGEETETDSFSFSVGRGDGWTADWTATVTVIGVNDPPEISDVSPTLTMTSVEEQTIPITATDVDINDEITFALGEGAPAFVTILDEGEGVATVTLTPDDTDSGTHEFTVVVMDTGTPPNTTELPVTVTVQSIPGRVTTNLVTIYEFGEGSGGTLNASGGAARESLIIADPGAVTWAANGLTINSPTIISSAGAAGSVVDPIIASDELTIEAWVTSANASQPGPARIVTMSATTSGRNFTLGQGDGNGGPGGDMWSGRVRTTGTSANGLPALSTAAGSTGTGLTHLVFTRSASGEVTFYVNGTAQATGTAEGDLSGWDRGFALHLGNETTGDRPWLGTYHLVAIYDKDLSAGEVTQNYSVGP